MKIKQKIAFTFFVSTATVFLLLVFLFVMTILRHEKYRFFDPFLQIQPPLSPVLMVPKQAHELRILLLGGSTTRCATLPPEQRFDVLCQNKISKALPGTLVRVYNGGMDWYTTRHSLIAYTQYYRLFEPDIVVMMHGINDVCRSFTPLHLAAPFFKPDYSHFYGPAAHAAMPGPSYPESLFQAAGRFFYRSILGYEDTPVDCDSTTFRSIESFRYFYALLINEIVSDNAIAIVMGEPSLYGLAQHDSIVKKLWFGKVFCHNQIENNYKDYGKLYASPRALNEAMQRFNSVAGNLAVASGALYFDLPAVVNPHAACFTDDVHYTATGAALVADSLSALVLRLLYETDNTNTEYVLPSE